MTSTEQILQAAYAHSTIFADVDAIALAAARAALTIAIERYPHGDPEESLIALEELLREITPENAKSPSASSDPSPEKLSDQNP